MWFGVMKSFGSLWCALMSASLRTSVSSRIWRNLSSLSGYLMKMIMAMRARRIGWVFQEDACHKSESLTAGKPRRPPG